MKERNFELTRAWLVTSVVVATIAGIILIGLSSSADNFWSPLMSASGSAMLSVAIALLISDVVLKPVFTRDIFRLAQLKQRIGDVGLIELGDEGLVPWRSLYASSKSVQIVVTQARYWYERDIEHVMLAAKKGPFLMKIYLPEPRSLASETTARSLGIDRSAYDSELETVSQQLEEAWTNLELKDNRRSLEIIWLSQMPATFLAKFDGKSVLGIPATVRDATSKPMYIQFDSSSSSDISRWFANRWVSIERVRQTVPAWQSPLPRDSSEAEIRLALQSQPLPNDTENGHEERHG